MALGDVARRPTNRDRGCTGATGGWASKIRAHGQHLIRKFASAKFAAGGVGKSILALTEAIAMATGRPLLGIAPPKRLRVWYWNGEDPLEETERRIAAICLHFNIKADELEGWLFVDSGRDQEIIASKQAKPRKPPSVVHSTWLQTRYPNEETGDPGSVIDVHYTVEDNVVTLTNPKGAPISKQSTYVLQPGDAAVHIARRLAMVGPTWQREVTGPIEVSWIV